MDVGNDDNDHQHKLVHMELDSRFKCRSPWGSGWFGMENNSQLFSFFGKISTIFTMQQFPVDGEYGVRLSLGGRR